MAVVKESFNLTNNGNVNPKPLIVEEINLEGLINKLKTKSIIINETAPFLPDYIKGLKFQYEGEKRLLKSNNLYLMFENKPANEEGIYCTIFWHGKDESAGRAFVLCVKEEVLSYFNSLRIKLTTDKLQTLDMIFKKKE